jgi:hypothetical protein
MGHVCNQKHKQQMLVRMGSMGQGVLIHCWWEFHLSATIIESSIEVPKKLKIELPHHPAIPLPDIISKGM